MQGSLEIEKRLVIKMGTILGWETKYRLSTDAFALRAHCGKSFSFVTPKGGVFIVTATSERAEPIMPKHCTTPFLLF